MAVAGIDGLTETGIVRLQLSQPMSKEFKVLATFVDDRGQRYAIWENFGVDYYGSRDDVWLNLDDFHLDLFGRASRDWRFEPSRVKEVHLRFYFSATNEPVSVALSILSSRRGAALNNPTD